jgi:hypothetical protein
MQGTPKTSVGGFIEILFSPSSPANHEILTTAKTRPFQHYLFFLYGRIVSFRKFVAYCSSMQQTCLAGLVCSGAFLFFVFLGNQWRVRCYSKQHKQPNRNHMWAYQSCFWACNRSKLQGLGMSTGLSDFNGLPPLSQIKTPL